MYKFDKNHQFGLDDFNQPMGLHMNPENRWVKKRKPFLGKLLKKNMLLSSQVKRGCRQSH